MLCTRLIGKAFLCPYGLSWGSSNVGRSICSQAGSLTWLASSCGQFVLVAIYMGFSIWLIFPHNMVVEFQRWMSQEWGKPYGFLWPSLGSLLALLLPYCISQIVPKGHSGSREGGTYTWGTNLDGTVARFWMSIGGGKYHRHFWKTQSGMLFNFFNLLMVT